MNKVIFRIAKTEAEIQQCFSIRHSVFVEEQKLFKETEAAAAACSSLFHFVLFAS